MIFKDRVLSGFFFAHGTRLGGRLAQHPHFRFPASEAVLKHASLTTGYQETRDAHCPIHNVDVLIFSGFIDQALKVKGLLKSIGLCALHS